MADADPLDREEWTELRELRPLHRRRNHPRNLGNLREGSTRSRDWLQPHEKGMKDPLGRWVQHLWPMVGRPSIMGALEPSWPTQDVRMPTQLGQIIRGQTADPLLRLAV